MRITDLLLTGVCVLSSAAIAVETQHNVEKNKRFDGLSGFVNIGAGVGDVSSNSLGRSLYGSVDFGNRVLSTLDDDPDNSTEFMPVLAFELSYHFADTGTTLILGNQLEDYIRFDFATRAGIRQDIGEYGELGFGILTMPVPTEVWRDPFVVGERRELTDRTTDGYRLIWDRVMGTGLELTLSSWKADVDEEQSGQAFGLDENEQAMIDRNGDIYSIRARYTFNIDKQRIITPSVSYANYDLDGEALQHKNITLGLNYIFIKERWRHIMNLAYTDLSYDDIHPVFDDKADASRFGIGYNVFYERPFGLKGWFANAGIVWVDEDSDIDFYDASATVVTAGMLYRF